MDFFFFYNRSCLCSRMKISRRKSNLQQVQKGSKIKCEQRILYFVFHNYAIFLFILCFTKSQLNQLNQGEIRADGLQLAAPFKTSAEKQRIELMKSLPLRCFQLPCFSFSLPKSPLLSPCPQRRTVASVVFCEFSVVAETDGGDSC